MKLVALCGLQGAGKDTVADASPARKLAFADVLYREVADAFGVAVEELKCREGKEVEQKRLQIGESRDAGFFAFLHLRLFNDPENMDTSYDIAVEPRSPRQVLQWWGDYRRAQNPDYFVNAVLLDLPYIRQPIVITDCRFPNEAAIVRQLGGQIWQVVRPNHEVRLTGHKSESTGEEFSPDVVLVNDGTLDELRATALQEWNK